MKIVNKFLDKEDFENIEFQSILNDFEKIYRNVLKKKPHKIGSKYPAQVKIHWSRDWEYPWAIINSEVKAGEKVLDCGCGGSPLLPYLATCGCVAYGIDPNLQNYQSISKYYIDLIKHYMNSIKDIKNIRSKFKSSNKIDIVNSKINNKKGYEIIKQSNKNKPKILKNNLRIGKLISILKIILKKFVNPTIFKKKDGLGFLNKNPTKLGLNIKYFTDSIDNLHFRDNYFKKVYCISVIEHLPEEIAYKGMKEMARVLKDEGFLVITMDYDGNHVNPKLVGNYDELIKQSGLTLYVKSDFQIPKPDKNPGYYNVVGFVLKKKLK